MTLLLVATFVALAGWLVLRYAKHPASALGVAPFIIGMTITGTAIDKAFEHNRYFVLGYLVTALVAFVGIVLFKGRHKHRSDKEKS
jgi:hypothetical protein